MSMYGPHDEYQEACLAANPAAHVATLTDFELAALCRYAEVTMRRNSTPGGVPATMKLVCVMEAAERFFRGVQGSGAVPKSI